MILNAAQISETQAKLKMVLAEQKNILKSTDTVVLTELSGAWECSAQRAYADAYVSIKESLLTQINNLIELFGVAFEQSQNGLHQVDIDIAAMNSTVVSD